MRNTIVHYLVEGKNELKVVNTLKSELKLIMPGKASVHNVVEQKIPDAFLLTIQQGTIMVLLFDTDTGQTSTLRSNLAKLEKCPRVKEVVTIPQANNLEDELKRSCSLRNIQDLLNSQSKADFKRDLIKVTNLGAKLRQHNFNIKLLWSSTPSSAYSFIPNKAEKIKLL